MLGLLFICANVEVVSALTMNEDQMLTFINVDVALRRGDDWLLIVRGESEAHAAGKLSLVGGTFEMSEPGSDVLEQTARREVAEEVGVKLDGNLVYVESTFFQTDDGEPVVNVVLAGELPVSAEPHIAQPEEVAEVVWRTLDDLANDKACPPWTVQSIRRAEAALQVHSSLLVTVKPSL